MSVVNFLFRWSLRIIQPKEAKRMEQDGPIALPNTHGALPENTEYVFVDDQGADITVFAYSGMDALFAGRASFEFKRLFRSLSEPCNLVCFRDPRTCAFHLSPDGCPNGLEFYSERTRELMDKLGATRNIALGSSSGGMTAFTIGTRCGMDRIIGFAPAFPHSVYRGHKHFLREFFNFRALFYEPQAYVEVLIITIAVKWLEDVALKRFRRTMPMAIWDTWGIYKNAGDGRPESVVFYGERSNADARQAKGLAKAFPGHVRLVPVNTGRHNCPAVLLQQHKLIKVLGREISMVSQPVETEAEEGYSIP